MKLLVIGSPAGLVADDVWQDFVSRHNVRMYDFRTIDDFHRSLQQGDCSDIDGIVRIGLNIPPESARIVPGWTHRALDYLPKTLRVIVNFGHGINAEAVDLLKERGISFMNTTGGSESTGTVGTFLIIAAFRKLSRYERMVRDGQFLPALRESAKAAIDPYGKKLGIIGMGSIGQVVAKQATALGMKVHCIDRPNLRQLMGHSESHLNLSPDLPPLVLHQGLISLVQTVDCILLSCPYSKSTHHLLCKDVFDKMKHGMRVINIARGSCIDEEALCDAMESGIVASVGLDVHHDEPRVNERLLKSDNATLLPHVGGLSLDSMKKHALLALNSVDEFFKDLDQTNG